jgi:hypothetical protein
VSRRGIALLLAVTALAVLGTIAATAFSLARTERAVGLAALAEVQALAAADAAAALALRGWPRVRTPVFPGEELPLARLVTPGPADGWSVVRALGGPIFALRAWGVRRDGAGNPLAERRLELLVRLDSAGGGDSVRPRVDPRGWQGLVP